ncbi:MAG: DsbA family protein [Alphaproteobacteria bacterium]
MTLRRLISGFASITLMFAAFGLAGANAQQGNIPMADLLVEGPLADVWLGDEDAPVVIIEYASMTCPHGATFPHAVYAEFVAKDVDPGLVRYTLREFPIDPPQFPLSAAAFMLVRCAPGTTGYFASIDLLFETQPTWAQVQEPIPPLRLLMAQIGVNEAAFDACLSDQTILEGIYANYNRGIELGVNATPTFFINGDRYSGALTLEQLDQIIEPLL